MAAISVVLAPLVVFLFVSHTLALSSNEIYKRADLEPIIFDDIIYNEREGGQMARVSVGTPPQDIWLSLSLSENTWIGMSIPGYSKLNCSDETTYRTKCMIQDMSGAYAPQSSSSYLNLTLYPLLYPRSAPYHQESDATTYAFLEYAMESFEFSGSKFNNLTFTIANNYSGYYPSLGLGPSWDAPNPSFIDNFSNNGQIALRAFGAYLNDFRTNNSELHIGAVDRSKYSGNFTTLNVLTNTTNVASIDSVFWFDGSLNSSTSSTSNLGARMDFTDSYITISTSDKSGIFDLITKALKATERADTGTGAPSWTTSCDFRDSNQQFFFSIGGNSPLVISIPATQLILPDIDEYGVRLKLDDGSPSCKIYIAQMPSDGTWDIKLGAPFLRSAYMVYDFTNKQYSIAKAVVNATGERDIVPLERGGVTQTPALLLARNSTRSSGGLGGNSTSTSERNNGNKLKSKQKLSLIAKVAGAVAAGIGLSVFVLVLLIKWRKRKLARLPAHQHPDQYGKMELPAGLVAPRPPLIPILKRFPRINGFLWRLTGGDPRGEAYVERKVELPASPPRVVRDHPPRRLQVPWLRDRCTCVGAAPPPNVKLLPALPPGYRYPHTSWYKEDCLELDGS